MNAPGNESLLTPNQRRIVAGALTALSFVIIAAVLVGVFLLIQAFISEFALVIFPLAVAGTLALILQPVVHIMQRRLHLSRTWCVLILSVVTIVLLTAAIILFFPLIWRQITDFIQAIPDIVRNALNFLDKKAPAVAHYLRERIQRLNFEEATEQLKAVAAPAATTVMGLVERVEKMALVLGSWTTAFGVIPIYLFFFLLIDKDPTRELSRNLSFLRDEWRRDIVFLVRVFVQDIEAFFRGQIVIGLLMGILYAIGFSIVGLNFGVVLGLGLGMLNIVPYLGSIIGLATALPIAYLQPGGGFEIVLGVLVVFSVVQMTEGWLLTPKIMGNMTGLHPVTVIIAIFFWGTALDGILGMILAIPLTAFLIVAWRFVLRRYLSHLMEGVSEDHDRAIGGGGPPEPEDLTEREKRLPKR